MSVATYNNFQFHVQHNGYPVIHGHIGTYEFIFVISGEIRHKINGRKEILEQNSLCFLTPTDKHSLEKLTDDAIYKFIHSSKAFRRTFDLDCSRHKKPRVQHLREA